MSLIVLVGSLLFLAGWIGYQCKSRARTEVDALRLQRDEEIVRLQKASRRVGYWKGYRRAWEEMKRDNDKKWDEMEGLFRERERLAELRGRTAVMKELEELDLLPKEEQL